MPIAHWVGNADITWRSFSFANWGQNHVKALPSPTFDYRPVNSHFIAARREGLLDLGLLRLASLSNFKLMLEVETIGHEAGCNRGNRVQHAVGHRAELGSGGFSTADTNLKECVPL